MSERSLNFDYLFLVQISIRNKNKKKQKSLVIECGAHAREWISPATCMFLINEVK